MVYIDLIEYYEVQTGANKSVRKITDTNNARDMRLVNRVSVNGQG